MTPPAVDDRTRRWTLVAMVLTSSVVFLDGSVVQVALPAIGRGLGAGLAGLQWVVNASLLTVSSLLIVGGWLGDRYGRRRVIAVGLAGFAAASAAAGLAPSLGALVAARLAQGVAGALLVPSALAVVTAIHDAPEERGAAIGAWAAWGGAVGVVGPLAGGWLVDALGWRAVFFVNLPVVAAALLLLLTRVPETRDRSVDRRLDWAGALLVLAGLGGVAYGLIQGPSLGWARADVRAALVVGILALIGFVAWERRAPAPLLPLHLFASRNFSGANAVTLALYAAVGATLFVLMIFLQNAAGWPALRAGLTVLPVPAVMLLLAGRFGRLAGRLGARWFMTGGPLVSAAGLALLAGIGADPPMARVLAAMTVFALGLALTVAPLTGTVMSSVPERSYGRASAVNNAASRVAQLLAVTAAGLVLSATFAGELDARTARLDLTPTDRARLAEVADSPTGGARLDGLSPEAAGAAGAAFTAAFRRAMLLAAGVAALGGAIAALTIRDGTSVEGGEGVAPAPAAGSEHWPCLASRASDAPGDERLAAR